MVSNTTPAATRLDAGIIVRAAAAPLFFWAILVVMASWQGYPGIACMTPMAWLLGCWTGIFCAERSHSVPQRRIAEALIAGALLGIGLGSIFGLVVWLFMNPPDAPPGDVQKNLTLCLGILVFGTLCSSITSTWLAAMRVKRFMPKQQG